MLYLQLEVVFKIKLRMIHFLLIFYSFAGEDPNKHFKEFYIICMSIENDLRSALITKSMSNS